MGVKKWIRIWFIISFFIIVSVGSLNYIINPFGVFQTNLLKQPYSENRRFVKMTYLLKHKEQYNSYMFGSSRVGTTFPSDLEAHLSGSHFYNMAAASANLRDHELTLKYMLSEHFTIQNLYLQIDLDNAYAYDHPKNDHQRKLHPFIIEESLKMFYLKYLSIFPIKNMYAKLLTNFIYTNDFYNDKQTGIRFNLRRISQQKHNIDFYIANEPSFHRSNSRRAFVPNDPRMLKSIKAFQNIVNMCKKHDVNLIVVTTPHNHVMMDQFNTKQTLDFLKELTIIHPVWFFSGYNTVTNDDKNYFESSHYVSAVGKIMLARIFNNTSDVDIPKDFGSLLTPKNIDSKLLTIKENIKVNNR